jgi:asparagine synthase (glutamine-hydrolysing)
MCGICGIVETDRRRPAATGAVGRMTDRLRHRGPDGEGRFTGEGLALGVRRLSIVDPEGGDQPIASECGRITLVCNGEIYNAPDLRRELESRGHRFAGGSDVEVIVHLYEELGREAIHRLRGMFAIALWDDRSDTLLLARDRLGIKPLCLGRGPRGELCFASEAKGVLASGLIDARLDPRGLADAAAFGGPVDDRTLFEGISQLRPGEALEFRRGDLRRWIYWDVPMSADGERERRPDGEWVERFAHKLDEAVRIHLRSDVGVACWLSPGIDSSSVAHLALESRSDPLDAWSLRFDDPRFDELARFGTIADIPGIALTPRTIRFTPTDPDILAHAVWAQESPSSLQLAVHALAEGSAPHARVVLTGQGSDEVLAGYPWYRREKLAGPALAMLGRRNDVKRFVRPTPAPGSVRLAHALTDDLRDAVLEHERNAWGFSPPDGFDRWNRIDRLAYIEIKTRLVGFINRSLDHLTMAAGQEGRCPFLDHELVELCARMPTSLRLRGLRNKRVLRDAMRDRLPAEFTDRRKRGLRSPRPNPLGVRLRPLAEELLSARALGETGYLDPAGLGDVRRRARSGDARAGKSLSIAMCLQLWHGLFVDATRSVPEPAAEAPAA